MFKAIWEEIKLGKDGDVVGAFAAALEDFFGKIIAYLNDILEIK